jgi:hypothetical protein
MSERETIEPVLTTAMLVNLDTFVEIWEKGPVEGGGLSELLPGIPPESIVAPNRPTSLSDLFIA